MAQTSGSLNPSANFVRQDTVLLRERKDTLAKKARELAEEQDRLAKEEAEYLAAKAAKSIPTPPDTASEESDGSGGSLNGSSQDITNTPRSADVIATHNTKSHHLLGGLSPKKFLGGLLSGLFHHGHVHRKSDDSSGSDNAALKAKVQEALIAHGITIKLDPTQLDLITQKASISLAKYKKTTDKTITKAVQDILITIASAASAAPVSKEEKIEPHRLEAPFMERSLKEIGKILPKGTESNTQVATSIANAMLEKYAPKDHPGVSNYDYKEMFWTTILEKFEHFFKTMLGIETKTVLESGAIEANIALANALGLNNNDPDEGVMAALSNTAEQFAAAAKAASGAAGELANAVNTLVTTATETQQQAQNQLAAAISDGANQVASAIDGAGAQLSKAISDADAALLAEGDAALAAALNFKFDLSASFNIHTDSPNTVLAGNAFEGMEQSDL